MKIIPATIHEIPRGSTYRCYTGTPDQAAMAFNMTYGRPPAVIYTVTVKPGGGVVNYCEVAG